MMSPDMMKMAMDQMARMTPEQMAQMAQMAQNMDPRQMQEAQRMMNTMSPEQMQQMQQQAAASGLGAGGMPGYGAAAPQGRPTASTPLQQATRLKEEGNRLHTSGSYEAASAKYQEARRTLGSDSSQQGDALAKACLLNLASCALKLGRHGEAVQHCDDALVLEPNNRKALYRRGQGYLGTGQPQRAVADLQKSIELSPADERPVMQQHLEKALKQLASGTQGDNGDESSVTITDVTDQDTAPSVAETAPAASAAAPASATVDASANGAAASTPATAAPQLPPGMAGMDPAAQAAKLSELMRSNPGMMDTMESLIGNMSQEQLDAMAQATGGPKITKDMAKAQMHALKGMSPEQIQAMARQEFTPGRVPSQQELSRTAAMLQDNPEMLKQSMEMMRGMSEEQLAAAARAVGAPAGFLTRDRVNDIVAQASTMSPSDLQEAARVAAAAQASEHGSPLPGQPSGSAATAPSAAAPSAAAASRSSQVESIPRPPPSSAAVAAPASMPQGMEGMFSPEMMQMASSMMANMTPEDMQRMTAMAGSFGGADGPGSGGPSMGPDGMPQLSPEMMEKMNSPEMMDMMHKMMSTMDADQLSGMMRQSGMNISPEQAQQMKAQMERLSPRQMQWLMTAAMTAQRGIQAARRTRDYLAARPLIAAAIVVLIIAIILRYLGWV